MMPELFFIDEKKHILKYYDFEKHAIEIKPILRSNNLKMPMFTGIGRVSGRIFMFGGKDTTSKDITNKSYEVVKNKE